MPALDSPGAKIAVDPTISPCDTVPVPRTVPPMMLSVPVLVVPMSWVFASCGVAIFLPRSCCGLVMPGRTTSCAPPEVAPEITRMPSGFCL